MDVIAPRDPIHLVYAGLRALQTVIDVEGLALYVAGTLGSATHVLDITQDTAPSRAFRTLVGGVEAWYWPVGLADAYGIGEDLLSILDEPVPELVTPAYASTMFSNDDTGGPWLTVHGIRHLADTGQLYPFYVNARSRLLFADQVRAVALARTGQAGADLAVASWAAIRALFPPMIAPADLAVDLTPKVLPEPLPVRGRGRGALAVQALHIGQQVPGMTYQQNVGANYRVEVADGYDRWLPATGVPPWVVGYMDRYGLGARVAYRQGM